MGILPHLLSPTNCRRDVIDGGYMAAFAQTQSSEHMMALDHLDPRVWQRDLEEHAAAGLILHQQPALKQRYALADT